jgi:hypothetical protein
VTDLGFWPNTVRRKAVILVAVAGVAASAAMAAPGRASAADAAQVCRDVPAPTVASAVPDTRLDGKFGNYAGNHTSPDDWTGTDSTYSAPLPGGRDLWIFSDTFLAP